MRQVSLWVWRTITTVLAVAFILVPGSASTPFTGLPLNPLEALAAVTFLLICWATNWLTLSKVRKLVVTGLGVLIVLQVVGWLWIPYGWSVCLQREEATETLTTPCEPTAQFRSGERSYITRGITYEKSQFPLHFMNDVNGLNFYDGNGPDRSALLYSFQASAIFGRQDGNLTVTTNIPEITVNMNGNEHTVIPDQTLSLPLSEYDLNEVTVSYTTHNSISDALHVKIEAAPFYQAVGVNVPSVAWIVIYRILFWLWLVLIGILATWQLWRVILHLPQASWRHYWYATVWVLLLIATQSSHPAVVSLVLAGLVLTCAHVPAQVWRKSWVLPVLLFLVYSGFFVALINSPDSHRILEGGGDELTNESYARMAMLATDWQTWLQSSQLPIVFYYQPLYRYMAGAIHTVLGESLWAVYTVQTFLFVLATILAGRLVRKLGGSFAMGIYAVALVYVSVKVDASLVKLVSTTTFQQALALPLYFLAVIATMVSWLRRDQRVAVQIGIGLLWGVAVMTRTDLLPSILGLVFYASARLLTRPSWRRFALSIAGLAAGFAAPLLFVGLRNLLIAKNWVILPASGFQNLLPEIRNALPHVTDSTFGAATLLIDIPRVYATDLGELIPIIWSSMLTGMLGADNVLLFAWLIFIVLGFIGLLRGPLRSRLALAMLLISTLIPALVHSFFINTNIHPFFAHYSYLLAFLLPLTVGFVMTAWRPIMMRLIRKLT